MGTVTQQSIEILERTRDGEDLSPGHLALVEAAVNDRLNPQGRQAFADLHQKVIEGRYEKPWLYSIEHLTHDHEGYVYWKGTVVEHYSFGWGSRAQFEAAARNLAQRCRHLEAIGIEVNTTTAIWHWDWFARMTADCPFKDLLTALPGLYEHPGGQVAFCFAKLELRDEYGWPTHAFIVEIVAGRIQSRRLPVRLGDVEYHALTSEGYLLARCGQPEHIGPAAAPLAGVIAWLCRHGITPAMAQEILRAAGYQ